jgi:hypothetical protein
MTVLLVCAVLPLGITPAAIVVANTIPKLWKVYEVLKTQEREEGKTEAVWAAENPRAYERIQRIAGVAPVTDLHHPARR